MDILKKMFGKDKSDEKTDEKYKNEFKKPTWFDEYETDDELFDGNRKFMFKMFTNPLELQKHFEQQIQEIMKSIKEYEENGENFDGNIKSGFEEEIMKEFQKNMKSADTDLDGQIQADQLHSLLQRLAPEVKSNLPDKKNISNKKRQQQQQQQKQQQQKPKLTDEEKIMGMIHDTIEIEDNTPPIRRKEVIVPKIPPHFGGVFDGTYQGPKMFKQSIMTQTIRKPDGTYETKKVIRDTDGNVKTTITRTIDGKTETITTFNNGQDGQNIIKNQQILPFNKNNDNEKKSNNGNNNSYIIPSDCNIYVTENNYALPKNLW